MNRQEWANAVKDRDGRKCVVCGAAGSDAHHIFSERYFPKYRLDVGNGITLCRKCHVLAHRGSFINLSKYKCKTDVAITRLMERANSPSVRQLVERIVYAQEENMKLADEHRKIRFSVKKSPIKRNMQANNCATSSVK